MTSHLTPCRISSNNVYSNTSSVSKLFFSLTNYLDVVDDTDVTERPSVDTHLSYITRVSLKRLALPFTSVA